MAAGNGNLLLHKVLRDTAQEGHLESANTVKSQDFP